MLNLNAKASLEKLLTRSAAQPNEYLGNVPITVKEERLKDSMRVVNEFFRQLPIRSGLAATEILFVIDGSRPALYSREGREKESYFGKMKRYFTEQAVSLGYEVIDMQPIFIEKNRRDNSRFEFATDGHWNELGQRLVAEQIEKSAVFKFTFTRSTD